MAFAERLEAWRDSLQGFDVGDLTADNIGRWPTPIKLLVWAVVFGLGVGAGYKLHIADMQQSLATIQAKESKLKDEFKVKAFQAANLEAYRAQMVEMEASFGALVGQLPSDTEVPGLLEDITGKGVSSGLNFESIELQPEVKQEFYVELPIKVVAHGTYHDMGAFVSGVAGLPRIVTLHDFTIYPVQEKAGSGGEGSANKGPLVFTVTAKTFRYRDASKEEPEAVGKPTKGGKKARPAAAAKGKK